jgi:hypothetical protein
LSVALGKHSDPYKTMTEISFSSGFIKDEMAKMMDSAQPLETFLWTGRQASVGQRAETQINCIGGAWCRLSGIVTEVGALPTVCEWAHSDAICYGS